MRSNVGARLIMLATLIGLGISAYNYFAPLTGLTGASGVLVVAASSLLMLGAAFLWAVIPNLPRALVWFLAAAIAADILCTGFAAWLLESMVLLGAMALASIGWAIQIRGERA